MRAGPTEARGTKALCLQPAHSWEIRTLQTDTTPHRESTLPPFLPHSSLSHCRYLSLSLTRSFLYLTPSLTHLLFFSHSTSFSLFCSHFISIYLSLCLSFFLTLFLTLSPKLTPPPSLSPLPHPIPHLLLSFSSFSYSNILFHPQLLHSCLDKVALFGEKWCNYLSDS